MKRDTTITEKASMDSMYTGSSFDTFLEEEMRNELKSAAIKRVLVWQFEQEMEKQRKTKPSMVRELKTGRSQLDRILDPQNTAVTLETLVRAANILGKRFVFEINNKMFKLTTETSYSYCLAF